MKTVDPNTIKRIGSGRPLKAYSDYIVNLKSLTVGFSRSLGRLFWLPGDALNKARAKCKRGQWGIFLDAGVPLAACLPVPTRMCEPEDHAELRLSGKASSPSKN